MESNIQIKDSQETFQLAELTPEEVLEDWEALSEGISASLPPGNTSKNAEELLPLLTKGTMKCWLFTDEEEPWVLLTFLPVLDPGSKVANLLLYTIYAYKPVSLKRWTYIANELKKYGTEKGYCSLMAVSSSDRIIQIANILGWNTDYKILTIEL